MGYPHTNSYLNKYFLFVSFLLLTQIATAQFTVDLEIQNPLCGGFDTGKITATPSGGASPYFYKWSTGAVSSFIENLSPSIYTVTVTDSNNARVIKSGNITSPSELITSIRRSSCSGGGGLTAVATGGSGSYTYRWNTGQNTAFITNPSPREYCVTITDSRTCVDIRCITYTNTPIAVTVANGSNTSCNDNNRGSARTVVTGGSSPFTYYWNTGATTQNLDDIPPGVYAVTVTDATGCTANDSGLITATQGEGFDLNLRITQANCQNNNDGRVTANVSGGVGPFTYRWNTGATTATINNLSPGTYTVTVTANNGCQQTESIEVGAGSNLDVSLGVVNESCQGGNDGAITAAASNGQAPYQFLWSNGATSPSINNLTAGSYRVTVTDNRGCSVTRVASVLPATAFNVSVRNDTPFACGGQNTGQLTAMPTGGTVPFAIQWSNGANTATITDLAIGTYTVTVTDVRGCMTTASAQVQVAPAVNVSIQTNGLVCSEASNGVATAIVTGGTAPFTYLWSDGTMIATGSGFSAGLVSVTVTDNNGCTDTEITTFETSPTFQILSEVNNVRCNEDNNGSIIVRIPNGSAPFTIQNFTVATGSGSSAGQVIENEPLAFNDLPADTFAIVVTDAGGCMQTDTVVVEQPDVFTVLTETTPTSCLEENGTATAFPAGGTAPYIYQWEDGQTGATAFNLRAQMYLVTVTDANGCQTVANATVEQPDNLQINIDATELLCAGINTGRATASITNGTAPYTYQWDTGATTADITGLTAGTYCLTVTDAVGCTNTTCAIIGLAMPPTVVIQGDNVVCAGDATATLTAIVTNNNDNIIYRWSTGATEPSIVNVGTGTYSVTVTEVSGCSATASFTVLSTPVLGIEITDIQDVMCGDSLSGFATAIGVGGIAPYQYLWSDGQTTATGTGFAAGDYRVTVADANGCTASTGVTISVEETSIEINASVSASDCGDVDSGQIIVLATGGTFPYTFTFSNGFSETETVPNSGSQIDNLTAGIYSLTVTDVNGCTASADYTINSASEIELIIATTDETCTGTNDGSIEVNATGGVPPYRYEWSNGATTATQNNLAAGNYSVTVIDDSFCGKRATVIVGSTGGLHLSLTSSPSCSNYHTGSATVTPNQGVAPFYYQWEDGQTTATASNLPPGDAFVTVTDARGCMETGSVKIEINHNCLTDDDTELVRLFPNPVQDAIHVEIMENLGNQVEIELLDMRGGRLDYYQLPTTQSLLLIPVRNIPKGIYMVKVRYFGNDTGSGEQLLKVIKQ